MITSDLVTIITLSVMAFATAALLVYGLFGLFRSRKVAVQERLEAYTSTQLTPGLIGQVDEAELGLSPLGRLLRRLFGKNYFDRVEENLVRADLPLRPTEFILLRLVLGGALFIVGYLRIGTALGAVAFALVGLMAPVVHMKMRQSRRTNKFNEQLADCLMLMTNSLRAGYSFVKSLEVAATEMLPPLSKEFAKIFREVNLGFTMEEALQRAAKRIGSEDFNVVVSAYLVQKEVGGSLAEIMEKVAQTLRERFKLQGELRVMTSQGKLSGLVVGCLPIVVGLLLWLVAPSYLANLMDPTVTVGVPLPFAPQPAHIPMGIFLLGFALLWQVIGIIAVWRVVDIKV